MGDSTERKRKANRPIMFATLLLVGVVAFFIIRVAFPVAVFSSIRSAVQNFKIEGRSMQPTFGPGDYLMVSKLDRTPKRLDIIVYRYPKDETRDFVHRIIGLPGEVVRVENGVVFVSNQPLNESYIAEKPNYSVQQTIVPVGSYFVLGDNRNNSLDSHVWGFLPQRDIIGVVSLKYWPSFELVSNPAN